MDSLSVPLRRERPFAIKLAARLKAYWVLIKDLQTGLLLLTAVAGYVSGCCINVRSGSMLSLLGSLFLTISGSTVLNMVYDRDIDARMSRTCRRPLPSRKISPQEAVILGLALCTLGLGWAFTLDSLYGVVVLAGIFFDGVVYTLWLKRRSPYSIIIGGLAGGMPVLAGRVLAVGRVDWLGIIMVVGVLLWIPTHIMTFSIKYAGEYRKAGIPTFPSAYGVTATRLIIAGSTILAVASMLWAGKLLYLGGLEWYGLIVSGVLLIAMVILSLLLPGKKLDFLLFKGASIYMLCSMLIFISGGFKIGAIMENKPVTNKFLRTFGIILLSLTEVVTLLGGIGTTCVAFNAENFGPRMAALVPVKPVFQILVVVSIAAALFGLYTTFMLGRGRRGAYRNALLFLVVGLISSGIQMYFSATLRGSTAPNNMRVYLTAITLLVFLLFRIPGIWQKTGFSGAVGKGGSGSTNTPAALALVLCGLVVLSMPEWGAPTHLIDGYNTVTVLLIPLTIAGSGLVAAGAGVFFKSQAQKKGARRAVKAGIEVIQT